MDIKSIFDIYGYEDNFEIKDGKKIWYDPKFELNPGNNDLYLELNHDSQENTVVVYPIFTTSAYNEPGFYSFFRGECDEQCLTVSIDGVFSLDFTSSGNGYQVFSLLGYPIISDIDVDKNPSILEKYDKIILLHNEYVSKKEFDAITKHPKVIYLYPNALYAEVKVDYQNNSITLLKGHNFPESEIRNGFDWKYDNSVFEYDVDCKNMQFDRIENGWMLNCYPENAIHQSKVLLKMIKEF
ncbi:MAG: hypothetical protein ACW9W3_06730 [Candidatus Nitrosopumilus sp. bin_68KS]